jgi:hypothetical protein
MSLELWQRGTVDADREIVGHVLKPSVHDTDAAPFDPQSSERLLLRLSGANLQLGTAARAFSRSHLQHNNAYTSRMSRRAQKS